MTDSLPIRPLADYPVPYRSESGKAPERLQTAVRMSADGFLAAARAGTAILWQGDYHQARQLLAAAARRLRKPPKPAATPAEAFHKHRLARAQHSRLLNMLLVETDAAGCLTLPRAPDIQAALADVYGSAAQSAALIPLKQLLGFIGAHEWHKKGVEIDGLDGRIHVPYGVFSPLRGEYLPLVMQAALPRNTREAWDIGTGSGVLAALLARRGVPHITATDTNSRAAACARANAERLGLAARITVEERSLFPEGYADLIVCNPPWLPAKPTSAVETALYDPGHAFLHALLAGAASRLNPGGELWLVMSDLAEHLGLRAPDELAGLFGQNGWRVCAVHTARARHPKAADPTDPLAFARMREQTALYILQPESRFQAAPASRNTRNTA